MKAFDAKDGKLAWTFYTVPGPGELGHETWPQDSDVWKHGGAPVWQTPAVDPELGLIYFSTGNPGPVCNGGVRKGDNLFSVSIVALDAKTGKYRWHFQQVHHDIWDYDSPNPVMLFDAELGGSRARASPKRARPAGPTSSTATTGKPLLGIDETPVMQEPRQATRRDAAVPASATRSCRSRSTSRPKASTLVNDGKIFTPFWTDPSS